MAAAFCTTFINVDPLTAFMVGGKLVGTQIGPQIDEAILLESVFNFIAGLFLTFNLCGYFSNYIHISLIVLLNL